MPKEEKGYWFSTENGTHIHAEEGESKESAMKKKFSKFGKTDSKKDTTFEDINAKRMGIKKPSWEDDFSPEEVKKMKNEYSGKEEHIKKLKDAGFTVDETYKAGNTYKIGGKNFGDEASISIGEDGKYFRVTTNGGSYTYKDLDTAIDRAKYISGKAPSQDAIGWETGSYDAKTEQEFLMGKSKEQEKDFNDPMEADRYKAKEENFHSQEYNEISKYSPEESEKALNRLENAYRGGDVTSKEYYELKKKFNSNQKPQETKKEFKKN